MKQFFSLFFVVFFAINSFAQNLNPYQLSNQSGVNGLGFNPASIADTRYSFHMSLAGFNTRLDSNLVHNSHLPFSKKSPKINKSVRKVGFIDIAGPSVMVQLPKGNSFAISTRYRAGQAVSDPYFADVFENTGTTFTDKSLYYRSSAIREYGFSYAHPFVFKNHFIKAGATVKLLSLANSMSINIQKASLSSRGTNKVFSAEYAGFSLFPNEEASISNILKKKIGGTGLDLGFIYEFRPKSNNYSYQMDGKSQFDPTKNKYQLKFGLSIMDIGNAKSQGAILTTVRNTIDNYTINDESTSGSIEADLQKIKGFETGGGSGYFNSQKLPTRLNLFIDAKLGEKGWYLGAFLNSKVKELDIISLKNLLAPAQILAIIPRYEKDGFDFSIPITYQKETKQTGIGLFLNLGALYLGTESLNGFFQKNGPSPTLFAGFNILKLAKKIKDKDNDGVSDKEDICPDIKGLWAFKGCPDTDGDGIKDNEDDCPEHAGPKETKGCPDTDKDGIFDKNDACPNAAGPAKFNGCPDTDNDGIPDNEDECPTKPGSAAFGGCPDTDKDGLMDNEDECPELPGIKLLKGCPDADGDGIADKNDACPDAKGSLANKGCPDTDGDGIIDKEDNCPTESGSKTNNGCPDTDNDGIIDKNDGCPKEKGTLEYSGCPLMNFTKPNTNLSNEQNDVLNKITNEILDKNLTETTIEQLKNTVLTLPNSKLIFVTKGSKSSQLKQNIQLILKEKLGAIGFEIIEENEINGKTGLEIRVGN